MARYKFEEVDKAVNTFAKKVVKTSRANLTRSKANVSKDLWKSVGYRFKNGTLSFFMDIYGAFQDRGVTGHGRNTYTSTHPRPVAKSLSGYKFKTGPVGPDAIRSFRKWMKSRNIKGRNKLGRFITDSSTNFLLRRATGRFGIQPKRFFTDAFEKLLPEFDKKINKAVTSDVNKNLDSILKNF